MAKQNPLANFMKGIVNDTQSKEMKIFNRVELTLRQIRSITNIEIDFAQMKFKYFETLYRITISETVRNIILTVDPLGYDSESINRTNKIYYSKYVTKEFCLLEKLKHLQTIVADIDVFNTEKERVRGVVLRFLAPDIDIIGDISIDSFGNERGRVGIDLQCRYDDVDYRLSGWIELPSNKIKLIECSPMNKTMTGKFAKDFIRTFKEKNK